VSNQIPSGLPKIRPESGFLEELGSFDTVWRGSVYGPVGEVGANTGVVQVSRGVLHLEPVPRPVWDAEPVRHIIGGLVVAGHRCRSRPSEVVVQHLSQRTVVG